MMNNLDTTTRIINNINVDHVNRKYRWQKRVSLASIMLLSSLNKKCNHIEEFIRLARILDEPLVSPLACLGLIVGLFQTKNEKQLDAKVELIAEFKGNTDIELYLINAFNLISSDELLHKLGDEYEKDGIPFYETFHENASYHDIDTSRFDSLKERRSFFFLLNKSLSLSYAEKKRVFYAVNRLKRQQIIDLIRIYNEEVERFQKLREEAEDKVIELTFRRGVESTLTKLHQYPKQLEKLKRLKESNRITKIAEKLCDRLDRVEFLQFTKLESIPENLNNNLKKLAALVDYLISQGKHADAELFSSRILELDSLNFKAHFNLAYVSSKKKDYDKAIFHNKNALKIKPKDTSILYNLGLTYWKSDQPLKTIKTFKKVLEINPNKIDVLEDLASIQVRNNQEDEGIKNIRKVIDLKPDSPEPLVLLGRMFRHIRKFKESKNAFNKALEIDKEYRDAWDGLGWLHFVNGKFKKSRKYYLKRIRISMEKHALMNIGHCELILDSEKSAINYYQLSLDLFECSERFFNGMLDDLQYMKGIKEKDMKKIIKKLREYCKKREKKALNEPLDV